ncbi:hypothetical protein QFC21_003467 [Naganishia friedmannii]|uniref:Uncharacterized protein n=1 Tax=Naganishia friedmannii TaxID=89922 RepID=A0ACC2VQ02_9TREE|nr:hypothetical protein QFC21_003467 [Naganishia friedmannii]
MTFHPLLQLSPGIQSYDWGKIGSDSLAAQLGTTSVKGFKVDEEKPYAELWMGTHDNLPTYIASSENEEQGDKLASTLAADPERYVSKKVVEKFPDAKGGHLPFLLKVLSIGKALSIQAHPDKELAKKLNSERGDVYKDPNHKPEMAIALTHFRGFCGFLPHPTLLLLLTTVPEMRSLIGEDALRSLAQASDPALPFPDVDGKDYDQQVQQLESLAKEASSSERTGDFKTTEKEKKALKQVFEVLMDSPEEQYTAALRSLIERYESNEDSCKTQFERALVPLVKELHDQFPEDIGVLCCFILNVVEMDKGAAMFLKANEPHAYISGDIIECMATSDNVVRAGLTPKLRDVPTLISMLTYTSAPAHAQLLEPTEFAPKTLRYNPPIEEFSVLRLKLTAAEQTEVHRPIEGPSMVVVTDGSGKVVVKGGEHDGAQFELKRGQVIFIAAEVEVEYTANREEGLELFRAYVEA